MRSKGRARHCVTPIRYQSTHDEFIPCGRPAALQREMPALIWNVARRSTYPHVIRGCFNNRYRPDNLLRDYSSH